MSDCGTQAMMPKERRICGNCNNCDFDWMECEYIEEDGTHRKVAIDTPACDDWEKRALTDDERYERLVQLAMQMRDWLFYYVETDPGHVVVESDQDEVREIREAFDALVVSVDD